MASAVERALANGYDESQNLENSGDPDAQLLGKIRLGVVQQGGVIHPEEVDDEA